jgi:hypothetical protein
MKITIGRAAYIELFQYTNTHKTEGNTCLAYEPEDLNLIAPSLTTLDDFNLRPITNYGIFLEMLEVAQNCVKIFNIPNLWTIQLDGVDLVGGLQKREGRG